MAAAALVTRRWWWCRQQRLVHVPILLSRRQIHSGSLISTLKARGLLSAVTSDGLEKTLENSKHTVYCGADPTAQSLHVGHILPLMILLHFQIRGHNVIGLVGDATVRVGDPSGRLSERPAQEVQVIDNNINQISMQINQFFERAKEYANSKGLLLLSSMGGYKVIGNYSWWKSISLVDFLSNIGPYIRVSQMLARQSVKSRLESPQGIGYNEFTYQILQAYDFYHLYKHEDCHIQVGGNDQWGNITAGIDLISKLSSSSSSAAYGITAPLLTTPTGEKFGKSAGNAIWLNSNLTSPFQLYQYFARLPDQVVDDYLKIFTLLSLEEIKVISNKHNTDPSKRFGQHILAYEVTHLIHGKNYAIQAQFTSNILYHPENLASLDANQLISAFENDSHLVKIPMNKVIGVRLSSFLSNELERGSKKSIERILTSGGVYMGKNFEKILDKNRIINHDDLLDGRIFLARIGKQDIVIAKIE